MKEFNAEELIKDIDNTEEIKKLSEKYLHTKVVLGVDIYKYSQYPLEEQIYIPVLFNLFYEKTVGTLLTHEAFFFDSYAKKVDEFKEQFISTGDGGFQIFDDPIQAILFSIYFQAIVKKFVTGSSTDPLSTKLHRIIDMVELRYAITTDRVYRYKSNYFGPAIINNARILSKDHLNRLLVDYNTIRMFSKAINSVENLIVIDKEAFLKTTMFGKRDEKKKTGLFNSKGSLLSVHLLKIGAIQAKNTSLDIYNLCIQALASLGTGDSSYSKVVVTLGNLNVTGID